MKHNQTPKITVAIRKRPLNKKQLGKGETDIIKIENQQSVIVSEYKQKVDLTKYIQQTTFNFDYAFDQSSTNEEIYQQSIRPLIDSAFEGAKISCFAYGQTGSGKTFTMKGDINKGVPGLYFLAAKEIFNYLEHPEFQRLNILVSFYQIYCGKLYDLLNDRKQLKIRQDKNANINIIGIEQKAIYSANEFLDVIEYGSTFRITSQNATNADSSRSHAIMQITLKDGKKVFSKVSFIDLAGNERGADHMDQNKQTKIDGAQINKSLLALKECIRALDQGKGHTPFRGSKLTMVLKDSFVGFCKTVMIGNVSPNVSSSQNTMNTLRYADRVKQLKRPSQSLSKQQMQAKQLMLPRAANKNSVKVTIDREDDAQDIQKKLQMAKKKPNVQVQKMDVQTPSRQQPVTLQKRGSYKQTSNKDIMAGKKTDSASNAYRIQDRKSPYHSRESQRQESKNNQNVNNLSENGSKKNIMSNNNGPLFQKNNNINSSNQDYMPKNKTSSNKTRKSSNELANLPLEQLNRQHFDAMNSLHAEFSHFKDNHSKFVKQETIVIRDQMMRLGQMSQVDEYNGEANQYLDMVEKSIQEKMKLMEDLRNEVQNLKRKKKQVDEISRVLQQQKNQENSKPKSNGMDIEYPRASINPNPIKYTYHSTVNNKQQTTAENSQHSINQPYRVPQSYNYSYSYNANSSTNPSNQPSSMLNGYQLNNNQKHGYQQYGYQHNNFIQQNGFGQHHSLLNHHDQQLLQDLPGDENMQKLF